MLIAFDYDGVLVDSMNEIVKFANSARHLVGYKHAITKEDLQHFENLTFEGVGRFLGISEDMLLTFSKQVMGLLRTNLAKSKVFEGMPEVMRQLAEHHIVVLITSNIKSNVQKILSEHNLASCVTNIFDGSDPASKSEKLRQASKLYNVSCPEIIMIGDTKSDIRQGKMAQVKTIAVTWGYQTLEMLLLEEPDYVANCPNDLLAICHEAHLDTIRNIEYKDV